MHSNCHNQGCHGFVSHHVFECGHDFCNGCLNKGFSEKRILEGNDKAVGNAALRTFACFTCGQETPMSQQQYQACVGLINQGSLIESWWEDSETNTVRQLQQKLLKIAALLSNVYTIQQRPLPEQQRAAQPAALPFQTACKTLSATFQGVLQGARLVSDVYQGLSSPNSQVCPQKHFSINQQTQDTGQMAKNEQNALGQKFDALQKKIDNLHRLHRLHRENLAGELAANNLNFSFLKEKKGELKKMKTLHQEQNQDLKRFYEEQKQKKSGIAAPLENMALGQAVDSAQRAQGGGVNTVLAVKKNGEEITVQQFCATVKSSVRFRQFCSAQDLITYLNENSSNKTSLSQMMGDQGMENYSGANTLIQNFATHMKQFPQDFPAYMSQIGVTEELLTGLLNNPSVQQPQQQPVWSGDLNDVLVQFEEMRITVQHLYDKIQDEFHGAYKRFVQNGNILEIATWLKDNRAFVSKLVCKEMGADDFARCNVLIMSFEAYAQQFPNVLPQQGD